MTLDDPSFVNNPPPFANLAKWYAWFSIFLITFSSLAFTLADDISCKLKFDAAFTQEYGFG